MSNEIDEMMADARQAVLGVITARFSDDVEGASLVIDGYIGDSKDRGYEPAQAWAQMFAAAILLVIPLLECRATHHEEEMTDTLHELGMALAEYRLNYG